MNAIDRWHGISIVYCDNHVLVAVKPPNLPSQADDSGDRDMFTEMKAYIKEKYCKPGEVYLGLLHRLDRPVGGLMAFARTSKAASRLSEQLRAHDMRRGYLCVAQGESRAQARLENILEYDDGSKKQAALRYERLGYENGLSLLSVSLETGRKHQIRVQMSHCGHPIVYDMRYGTGKRGENIALWGAKLTLTHPTLKMTMTFASLPRGSAFEPYRQTMTQWINQEANQ